MQIANGGYLQKKVDDGDGYEDHDGDSHEDHDGDGDVDHDVDDRVQSANGGYPRRKVRCSSRVSQKLIPHPLSCLTWGQLSRIQIQIQIQKDTNTNNNII